MMRRLWFFCSLLILCGSAAADEDEPRLLLFSDVEARIREIQVEVRKPFLVTLVAERDAESPQVSTVAFKLEVPEGISVLGEELLVQSLVAIGTPRAGMHLAFHCVEAPQVPVYRFRMVATRPVGEAVLRTQPVVIENEEGDYEFLGIVACRDETFEKWTCAPASLKIQTR
jgi:hypothetical protein